jgi:transposase InsO family protein
VVGRRYGVSASTICKWVKKAREIGHHPIPTKSSRPKSHPNELDKRIIQKIVDERLAHHRCAEAVHKILSNQGLSVSLSSVKRTLDRKYLTKKRSPWKRYHAHIDRPLPLKPGDLMQIDTIHTMQSEKERMYTFVIIDLYSRWVYARSYQTMNAARSVAFVREAQAAASFRFNMLQSDHGPEFGRWFVEQVHVTHRYTRIGKPNDNAHIERFNRTVQEECLDKITSTPLAFNRALKKYLQYYNCERLHLGISLQTPMQLLDCVQGIG